MMYFKTNLPGWERAIRIAMGIMVAGLAYLYAPSPVMTWVGITMGAMFAGLAGCFFAAKMTAISPDSFTFLQSLMILVAVVLGGMGKISGMVVGALVMVLFPEVFRSIGSSFSMSR